MVNTANIANILFGLDTKRYDFPQVFNGIRF